MPKEKIERTGVGDGQEVLNPAREYEKMLKEHNAYTLKIRNLSSLGVAGMDPRAQDKLRELDIQRNALHQKILRLASLRLGKNDSDVAADLLLLRGNGMEYGVDLPFLTRENSPIIGEREKYRAEHPLSPQSERSRLQDNQPVGEDEVFLPVGSETYDQIDLENRSVSTYGMEMEGQEPAATIYIFSKGFKERIAGVARLAKEHPGLARLAGTGDLNFHKTTRLYGLVVKKRNLITLCQLLYSQADKYLPPIQSEGTVVRLPIGETSGPGADMLDQSPEMLAIPDEMLSYGDLWCRFGKNHGAADEYLKKRWPNVK